MQKEKRLLERLFRESAAELPESGLRPGTLEQRPLLDLIVDSACHGRNKAALAVTMTLLLKKAAHPKQDIRLHQAGMDEGFSGRGLDERVVTPFLRERNFPFMGSGSGWLTRSFEQAHPYSLDYPGRITPAALRSAFLNVINEVEKEKHFDFASDHLRYVFGRLRKWREQNSDLRLSKPTNRRIEEITALIEKHWDAESPGVARLPVLAVYAVYECLISEVSRYKDCRLRDLLPHTAADARTDRLGDIDIESRIDGGAIEAIEIKHGLTISASLIEALREKIAKAGVKRFYILSTREDIDSNELTEMTNMLIDIRRNYGCQVILNGVSNSIKYYLRLLSDTDRFLINYVSMVEADADIPFTLKSRWNEIVDSHFES